MRLALLSDIHGNSAALDAVLADIAACGGVDGYRVLGDLVAIGPDPVGVLERLDRLSNVEYLRGNTDRYVFAGDRPGPLLSNTVGDPAAIATLVEVASTFAWTQGCLQVAGKLPWLESLPLELRATLPDGTRWLGVHASPGRDDGPGFAPAMSDDEIVGRLADCDADLVCAGHTHQPFERRVERWNVVNLGCISDPPGEERRASYVLLHADAAGYRIEHRLVDYDRRAVVEELRRIRHPGADFIARKLLGS